MEHRIVFKKSNGLEELRAPLGNFKTELRKIGVILEQGETWKKYKHHVINEEEERYKAASDKYTNFLTEHLINGNNNLKFLNKFLDEKITDKTDLSFLPVFIQTKVATEGLTTSNIDRIETLVQAKIEGIEAGMKSESDRIEKLKSDLIEKKENMLKLRIEGVLEKSKQEYDKIMKSVDSALLQNLLHTKTYDKSLYDFKSLKVSSNHYKFILSGDTVTPVPIPKQISIPKSLSIDESFNIEIDFLNDELPDHKLSYEIKEKFSLQPVVDSAEDEDNVISGVFSEVFSGFPSAGTYLVVIPALGVERELEVTS